MLRTFCLNIKTDKKSDLTGENLYFLPVKPSSNLVPCIPLNTQHEKTCLFSKRDLNLNSTKIRVRIPMRAYTLPSKSEIHFLTKE